MDEDVVQVPIAFVVVLGKIDLGDSLEHEGDEVGIVHDFVEFSLERCVV